jgi:hypothetical protein
MVTPPTGRPFRRPRKDIRFRPEGYILGFAHGYRRLGAKTRHAAVQRALEKIEGERDKDRYEAMRKLLKTRSPQELYWIELVGEPVRIDEAEDYPDRAADLAAAVQRVDTAAESKVPFRLGQGRCLGQLNKQPGWLMRKLMSSKK